jgi:hypothetical protein
MPLQRCWISLDCRTGKTTLAITSGGAPLSASLASSEACAVLSGSGVHTLGSPPEEVFGEGILLTKFGAGTVTVLVFLRGAGVGMRVLGAHNFALSSFSMARRPLPGFPPLACMQQHMLLANFAVVLRRGPCGNARLVRTKCRIWVSPSMASRPFPGFPPHACMQQHVLSLKEGWSWMQS